MSLSEKDAREQTILDREARIRQANADREARVAQERAELDARNFHAGEDRKTRIEQENKARAATIEQEDKARGNRTLVALISALAAIGATFGAAVIGIEKLDGATTRFSVITSGPAAAPVAILKVDTKTGQTWSLEKSVHGLSWRAVQ